MAQKPMTILLVEDNPADAHFLKKMLTGVQGGEFAVTHVECLSQALQRLRQGDIQAVLLDPGLPHSHGLHTIKQARAALPHMPIVVLTGLDDEEFGVQAVQEGAQDFLIKGRLDRQVLVRSLRYAVERYRVEEELRHAEAKYRALLESAGQGIYGVDLEGLCTLINHSGARMLGYEPHEVLGKHMHGLVHHSYPDGSSYPTERCKIYSAFRTGEGYCVDEEVFWRRDGKAFPVEYSSYPIKSGGRVTGAVVSFMDISERKRADALKAAQNRVLELVALGRSLPEVLAAVAHSVEEQFFGIWCSVMLLGGDGNHLHLAAAPSLPKGFARAIEGLKVGPSAGTCGTAAWRREPVIASDIATDPLWVEFRDSALMHGLRASWSQPILSRAGKVLGTICLYYPEPRSPNPTERQLVETTSRLAGLAIEHKQGEERLALYHQIFSNSNDGIAVLDPQGYYLEQNAAHRALLGFSDDELRGQTPAIHLGEEKFSLAFQELMKKGQCRVEVSSRTKGGETRIIDLSAFVVRNKLGDPVCCVGIKRDVTERKQAEEQLRQSFEQVRKLAAHLESVREEERTRIAREIHDELGQVLTGLKLDVAWMEKRLLDAKGEILGFPLLVKLRSMSRLIDTTTKSVKKISAELRPGVLDEIGLLPAIEWQAHQFLARTGIRCKVNLYLRKVSMDQERTTAMFRIFQEILTNVARHATATEVVVTVRESVGHLVLEVKDNGKGITEAESSDPHAFGILGMRERALQCGGEVTISGSQGKGTTVLVRIPLVRTGLE